MTISSSSSSSDDIIVKPLTSDDIHTICGLHSALLPLRYPLSFFIHLLIQPNNVCLVAHSPSCGVPVAFVSAAVQPTPSNVKSELSCATPNSSSPSERHVQILTLGVLPEFRHRGIARTLVRAAVTRLSGSKKESNVVGVMVSAHVSLSNTGAHNFYERIGLLPTLEIRDLYRGLSSGSSDAHLMVGYLAPPCPT